LTNQSSILKHALIELSLRRIQMPNLSQRALASFNRGNLGEFFRRRGAEERKKVTTRDLRLLALLGGLMLGAPAALAADLPSRTVAPVMPVLTPAPYSWSGVYIGVNGGGGFDHFGFPYTAYAVPAVGVVGTSGINSGGPVAGAQVGFNMMLTSVPIFGSLLNGLPLVDHMVTGLELDTDWANLHGSSSVPFGPASLAFGTRVEDFGTARWRIGYAFDRLLVYLTGGLTFATIQTSYSIGAPYSLGSITTTTRTGIPPRIGVAGGGLEYALTNKWTVKAEYLYDYVGARYALSNPAPGVQVGFGTRTMYHIARIGLNYKFDLFAPPAPVIAKY